MLLGGHLVDLRSTLHDVIYGLLRRAGSAENSVTVILFRFKPSFDIGRVLIEFRFHLDLDAQQLVSELCD